MCISQSCPSPTMDKLYFATKHVKAQTLIPRFGRFLGELLAPSLRGERWCQSRVCKKKSHFTLGHKLRLIQHFPLYVTMPPSTFSSIAASIYCFCLQSTIKICLVCHDLGSPYQFLFPHECMWQLHQIIP